jgi:hypothetical protein
VRSGCGQEEAKDGAEDEGQLLHRATHSIHFAIPPACSMILLASACGSWHRAQAARAAGASRLGQNSLMIISASP